jgi:phosphoglycolate phosphatase-like HAD superfamily hydrolase
MHRVERIPNPEQIKYIGWDVDDTLVPEMEPKASALEQMSLAFASKTGIPYEVIQKSIKDVYAKRGTDYHNLIQEMDCFEDYIQDKVKKLREMKDKSQEEEGAQSPEEKRKEDQIIMNITRSKLIDLGKKWWGYGRDLYPKEIEGVRSVLEALISKGIKNFALSNADIDQASRRLDRAGFFQYFQLVAGVRRQVDVIFPQLDQALEDLGRLGDRRKKIEVEISKPNTNLVELLGLSEEEIKNHMAFVGDSELSDMKLAGRYGSVFFHALYNIPKDSVKDRFRRFVWEHKEAKFVAQEKMMRPNGLIPSQQRVYPALKVSDILYYLGMAE